MNQQKQIEYVVEFFHGKAIGNSYMVRVGYQVTAYDAATGKRVYAFENSRHHRTPCAKIGWVASHYKSGVSKIDAAQLERMKARAVEMAAQLNREEYAEAELPSA